MAHTPPLRCTREQLQDLLEALDQDHSLINTALGGQCDAFARALSDAIEQRWPGTPTHPILVERLRMGLESGDIIEHNPFSHILLEVALQDGTLCAVDAGGLDADARWEDEWIQPGELEEVEPSEDTFKYTTTTFEDVEVRRQRDRNGAGIDPAWVDYFRQQLAPAAHRLSAVGTANDGPRARRTP